MINKPLLIVLIVALAGCSVLSPGYKLSRFSFNGKYHNGLIQYRIPDYGDGHLDGCVVASEMTLSLKRNKDSIYSGELKNVRTGEAISNAQIQVTLKDTTTIKIGTNENGSFEFIDNRRIIYINVSGLGYRSINIDLSKKVLR